MAESYRQITPILARKIKLIVTDIDGTLTTNIDFPDLKIFNVIQRLKKAGILVGLVSGRTMPEVESLAISLKISGPIVAENGGVAKYDAHSEMASLGYSREPAMKALKTLKRLFPSAIREREDNKYRIVDVVFQAYGMKTHELLKYLENVEILDSGYILHLVQKGVSKGRTLLKILGNVGSGNMSLDNVFVIGDSLTDLSLFQMFTNSALVVNPRVPMDDRRILEKSAAYISELPCGEGFTEVVSHILDQRSHCESIKSVSNNMGNTI
jgi:phosphoglycolate phosphatase (TIGR01487 family)